ncbi:MAG: hypothetical protein ACSHXY_06910 [Alphaproteobacteria bacterium]
MTFRHTKLLAFTAIGALLTACSNGHDPRHNHKVGSGQHSGGYVYNSPTGHYHQPQIPAYYAAGQGGHYQHATPQNAYYNPAYTHTQGQAYSAAPQYGYPQQQAYYAKPAPVYNNRGSKFSYESLNAFEAPVAAEIAGVTFELRGRVDSVADYSFETKGNLDNRVVGTHRISAEKQLPNRFTIGALFTGRHEDIGNDTVDYKGRVRGYVGGSWGTIIGGNVQDVVYEDTRRLRGAGNLVGNGAREENLAGDGALGRLNDWGGGYQGRFGPTTISTIVDEDANYDIGIKFQRPIGNKDYRLTARHNTGTFLAADGVTEIDTKAVSGVGEYVYGSTRYDLGGGYEHLETGGTKADRWFTSAGFTTKSGMWGLTVEGHYGEIEGQKEVSAFAGVKYDLARGLAATAAVDYEDRQINIGGVNYVNTKDTRALMGLSYGF